MDKNQCTILFKSFKDYNSAVKKIDKVFLGKARGKGASIVERLLIG